MKKLIIKSIVSGLFFSITAVIVVYAATTISSIGQEKINSGDKIGTGWYNEVDDKLNNFSNSYIDFKEDNCSTKGTCGISLSCEDGETLINADCIHYNGDNDAGSGGPDLCRLTSVSSGNATAQGYTGSDRDYFKLRITCLGK